MFAKLITSRQGGLLRAATCFATAILVFALAACGGGDDAAPTPPPVPPVPTVVAPTITLHPVAQNVIAGAAANFSVLAAGSGPLSYQWQSSSDGATFAPIAGATSPQYRIDSSSQAQDGWRFRVVVANSAGSLTSDAARLTVITTPSIAVQPAAQSVNVGDTVSFSVVASGTLPLSYQWQASPADAPFADISGATAGTYTLAAVTPVQDGSSYRVIISNAAGSVTSAPARLTVSAPTAGLACTGPNSTGWCKAREPGFVTSNRLTAVARVSDSIAVAVGDGGTIVRSTDRGQTWTRVDSGTTLPLTSVAFADAQYGLAGGGGDIVLRTVDGGLSWARERQPGFSSFLWTGIRGVATPAVDAGVAVTSLFGFITYRADASGSWSSAALSPGPVAAATNRLFGVAFADTTNGLAVGAAVAAYEAGVGAVVFRTSDGGRSWSGSVVAPTGRLDAVALASPLLAVAVGTIPTAAPGGSSQALLRSTDGGTTWQRMPSVNRVELASVAFAEPTTVAAVGAEGTVLRSEDAGVSWALARSDTGNRLNGIGFLDAQVGLAVGDDGTIVRSTDGGRSWVTAVSSRHTDLASVAFGPDSAVAAGAFGLLLQSVDGGVRWIHGNSSYRGSLRGVALAGQGVGYAVGSALPSGSELLASQDGGRSWSIANQRSEQLRTIALPAKGSGIVAGMANLSPVVLRFMGADPSQLLPTTVPPTPPICTQIITPFFCAEVAVSGLSFADDRTGVAVGTYGLMLRTGDGGATWDLIEPPAGTKPALSSVAFASPGVAVAAGPGGVLLRSADGGRSWTRIEGVPASDLQAVAFATAEIGYAVGNAGTILRTINGGLSWTQIPSGTSQQLNAIAFRDTRRGVIAGNNGLILVTASGGQ